MFAQRRLSRLAGAEGSFSTAEWERLIADYDRCPMCRRAWSEVPLLPGRSSVITADHIVPISKGGSNAIENIQPLCYSCNSKKGAKVEP
ncbi:MAG: HNH endonuclease [Deltaproteobacteria bacterium]|nr:HNH endonuclease [Deltaproteobacteria bacterium]